MSDYKKLDNDIVGGDYGKPVRLKKPVTTNQMLARLNDKIDKAIDIMTNAMNDEKKAYNAAKDVLSFYLQLNNQKMKEELHEEEMRFRRYKNKEKQFTKDQAEAQGKVDAAETSLGREQKFTTGFLGGAGRKS